MINISSISDNKEKIISSLNSEEGYQIFLLKDSESGWNYVCKNFFISCNCSICLKRIYLNSYENHVLKYESFYSFDQNNPSVPVHVNYIQDSISLSVLTKINVINNNLISSSIESKSFMCVLKISDHLLTEINPFFRQLVSTFEIDDYHYYELIGSSYSKNTPLILNLITKNNIKNVGIVSEDVEKLENIENCEKYIEVDSIVNNEFFSFSKCFFIFTVAILIMFIFLILRYLFSIYRKIFYINK